MDDGHPLPSYVTNITNRRRRIVRSIWQHSHLTTFAEHTGSYSRGSTKHTYCRSTTPITIGEHHGKRNGIARPQGAGCEMGAYEVLLNLLPGPKPVSAPVGNPSPLPVTQPTSLPVVTIPNPLPPPR